MNSRDDTEYWRQNGNNKHVSESLRQILQIWTTGKSLNQEMERLEIRSSYTAMSWYCLLAGYGYYPDSKPELANNPAASKIDMHEIDEFIRRCALNFRSQNEALLFS